MTENQKPTILLVDDAPANIDILVAALRNQYQLRVALNGETALKIVTNTPPDLILLDVMMPGMSGFDVCKQLKSNPLTSRIPVIFVTALGDSNNETEGLMIGAADYITKPINVDIVRARVACHLELYNQTQLLNSLVKQRTLELEQTREHIIQCLGRAAEYKDNETGLHVIRMSKYCELLARTAGLNDHFCSQLLAAAPMHDIGKIGIPDQILKKPSDLNNSEWKIMREHPELGANILGNLDTELMHMASRIALTHHERWNGGGYPYGIKKESIPLEGRIVAIGDVFDALTSDRPYKSAWSIDQTMSHLIDCRGDHFDPELLDIFIALEPELIKIREQHMDHNVALG
ncbi:HD domain-containing phosphohydrolase [Ferrimonas lipolytica]|uniref:Response regulator n=1 Tax=Ferrimonas lipolytica TaxID=2724191 RepID=A0A6H1UBV2_9GAMM|nr:HD domain-containing phosphohydrolase [Ferrimonas lipolytica]QIZ75686.1 response regulator [Ferrimonas lipolytica]